MAAKSKLNLATLVSHPKDNPDDLLLGASATPLAPVDASLGSNLNQAAPSEKTRFTNVLPTATFRRLHQLSFWSREDMSDILDAALKAYFMDKPDADRELPEKERVKRKLPSASAR